MLPLTDFRGVIFDVDDTLFDNYAIDEYGLHERSRLVAAHEVGTRRNLPSLLTLTIADSKQAFTQAKYHTMQAGVWEMLRMARLVAADEIEPDNPLLREICDLKDGMHEQVMRTHGQEVPGATRFVRALAKQPRLANKLAIASTASPQDIATFLDMMQLNDLFPADHIISRDSITHPKPHPEAFNKAFQALKVPEKFRGQVVVFEDDPRGIMSAKAAGLYTCAITTRYSREHLGQLEVAPDFIADRFQEFAAACGLSL